MNKKILFSLAASVLGNVLEHYDTALFGLLIPLLAPSFFPQTDPINSLILTFGILPIGLLTRPLGAIFFGRIGDTFGRKQALVSSLLGTAFVTMSMGFLPTYANIGLGAPCLLIFTRMLQSFFAAGESVGGAIFLLEQTSKTKKQSLFSSIYDASSLIGGLLATLVVSCFHNSTYSWRIPFWIGGLTALVGFALRITAKEPARQTSIPKTAMKTVLWEHKKTLARIVLVTGFSYTIYAFSFSFLGGYLPLISSLSFQEVTQASSLLCVADILLLPLFGSIACLWGKERLMQTSALTTFCLAIPLFASFQDASFLHMTLVRLLFVIFGTSFAAPYYAWALQQVPPTCRYTILATGTAIGSQLLGATISPLALWLYQITKWPAIPGLLTAILALGAALVVRKSKQPSINLSLSVK
ncbi:MAG: MHS family MFS transporter [Chlamydiae bacterium]|nr:MHS family MFS transporter [Chlamydiota bacterium]